MGRWKYVKPIYQALLDSNQKALAVQWYEEVADFYHPYVVEQLEALLGLSSVKQQPALVNRWNEKFLSGPIGNSKFIF